MINSHIAQRFLSVKLVSYLSFLEIIIDQSVVILAIHKEHAGFVVVQRDVPRLNYLPFVILDDWEMHQIFESLLILDLVVIGVLVDLHHRAV